MHKREQILDLVDDAMFMEPATYDDAILGVAYRFGMEPVVAYDKNKVLAIMCEDMDPEEAEEFFEFNTIGAWMGDLTPLFITLI